MFVSTVRHVFIVVLVLVVSYDSSKRCRPAAIETQVDVLLGLREWCFTVQRPGLVLASLGPAPLGDRTFLI